MQWSQWSISFQFLFAENPNYFALTLKSYYLTTMMMEYRKNFEHNYKQYLKNEIWYWRLSNEISSIKHGIIQRKYEPWSEEIHMQLLHIDVSTMKTINILQGPKLMHRKVNFFGQANQLLW